MASRYDADVDFDNWLNDNLASTSSPAAAAALSPAAATTNAEDKGKFGKDPWDEGDPWGGTGRPRPPTYGQTTPAQQANTQSAPTETTVAPPPMMSQEQMM